jgi:hypothetical protein
LISPDAAKAAAKRGIAGVRFDSQPNVASALAAGHAGVPVLVRRLDKPASDYYLVPWADDRGIVLVIQIDAERGVMSSAAALRVPLSQLVPSAEEARDVVFDQFKQRIVGEPELVWQPCRESASPLQPLYRIAVESGEAFVGVDGSVHPCLTPFDKGG